jgi:hypothetical protein
VSTLADLTPGMQFLMACQVVAVDPVNGIALSLFGPASAQAATATISPAGAMTGQLMTAPDQVPVNVITGFAPVAVGDVLENSGTGETAVCRWSQINADGTVAWASSAAHRVVYPGEGWTVIAHVDNL